MLDQDTKTPDSVGTGGAAPSGTFAKYALAIFDAGLGEPFPVRPDTKKPQTWDKPADAWEWPDGKPHNEFHSVTARNHPPITREHVEQWVKEFPNHDIGLVPAPGVVVFDLDQHDEKHGAENLAKALGVSYVELTKMFRDTLHVSGRGEATGWAALHGHWYYVTAKDTVLQRSLSEVPGVEVIGPGRQGYFVVAMGSKHVETGKRYLPDFNGTRLRASQLSGNLRNLPKRLLALYRDDGSERRERPTGGGPVQDAEQYAEDPRGEPDEAVQAVLDEYLDNYDQYNGASTHHDSALRVQLDLIHLAEAGHPGVWTALFEAGAAAESYFESEGRSGEWEEALKRPTVDIERMKYGQETGDWSYAPPVAVLRDPETGEPVKQLHVIRRERQADAEEAFWTSREVLTRLRDFARARRVAPWALLGCVLARVSASVDPSVVLPPLVGGPGSLNLFVALCGASGAGKTAAMAAAEDFLRIEGGIDHLTTGVGSGEGLLAAYVHNEKGTKPKGDQPGTPDTMVQDNLSVLFYTDEVQGLGALMDRTNSTLQSFLKSAWMGTMLATQNSHRETIRRVDAHSYRLAVVAGAQPEHAEVLLDDMGGGWPQRWLWMPTYDPGRLPNDVVVDEPERFCWRVPVALGSPDGKVLVSADGLCRMQVPDQVRQAVWKAQADNNRPIGAKAPKDTLDSHALFNRERVAALLALLDGRADRMTDKDWELSGVIAAKSDETRAAMMQAHAQEASREADRKAARAGKSAAIAKESEAEAATVRAMRSLRTKLEKTEGEWVPGSNLRKALGGSARGFFKDAIERLVDSGEVESREVEGTGQSGKQYRLK